jgi:hypothetical protein
VAAAETIVDLLHTGRAATDAEIAAILMEVASAPFSMHEKRVPLKYRGMYLGMFVGPRAPSAIAHLVQRVREEQWVDGTTLEEYTENLRAAATDSSVRLVIYTDYRGPIAGIFAATNDVVPAGRRGSQTPPWVYVVYAAKSRVIVSGDLVSALETTWQGADARWLR